MTRSAAVVPIIALCVVAGCGPHFRVRPALGEYRHPAVRWVYRSQEHVVLRDPPETGDLPALLAWHNEIRAIEPIEDGVALFEFDFGSRSSEHASHIVFLSVESGKRLRGSEAATSPNLSPHTLRKLRFATSLGDRSLHWENEPKLTIRLREGQHSRHVMLRATDYGNATLLHVTESGQFLIGFYVHQPLAWNPAYFVMCVDPSEFSQ